MYYPGKVLKFMITPENIDIFKYSYNRTKRDDYINDRKALENKEAYGQ